MRACKDCGSTTRSLKYAGPRCATCHRAVTAARKAASHERMVMKTYGLKGGEYQALYEAQGGCCAICRRAKGLSKKLSVDHDHKTGYVRGLLCTTCNKLLGHLRDDPELAMNIWGYLKTPPAQEHIGYRKAEDE